MYLPRIIPACSRHNFQSTLIFPKLLKSYVWILHESKRQYHRRNAVQCTNTPFWARLTSDSTHSVPCISNCLKEKWNTAGTANRMWLGTQFLLEVRPKQGGERAGGAGVGMCRIRREQENKKETLLLADHQFKPSANQKQVLQQLA